MPHTHVRARTLRANPLALALALVSMPWSVAHAADAPASSEKNDAERVEVTGSRIKGVDLEGASPVITVQREDLEKRGYDSIGDFLKDLPQTSSAGTFSEAGGIASGTRGQPAGSAGVSLRGLGSSATLVLVNGRRVAVDSFTNGFDSFVDINSIPMSAVERVEVLSDGASSVYGSDAIAGVINFILRKNIDSPEVSVLVGDDTAKGDFSRYNATLVTGFNTANSHTSVVLDYYTRNALMNSDRPVEVTLKSSTRTTIDKKDYAEPWCGSATSNGGTRCAFDYVIQRAIQPDTENLGLMLTHNTDLGGNREFFAEFMAQNNQGHAYDAPASFDVSVAGTYALNPKWVNDLNAKDGNLGSVRIRSRFPDRRTQEFDDRSWRALAGLRGTLAGWDWETAVSSGRAESSILHTAGFYSREKTAAAIAAGKFNPYNLGRDTDAATLVAMRDDAPRTGESNVSAWDFRFNGDLFQLPAGTVKAALGGEYRSEEMFDRPSERAVRDDIYALGSTAAAADRSQYAFYGEFHLPLTARLDAIAALRYDHYSDFGADSNPKLSLRWRATDDLIFRASWSTGFRAPSLSQLGSGTTAGSNFIDCGSGKPFNKLCGVEGAKFGELEFDQETLGNRGLDAETSTAQNLGASWNVTDAFQITLDYWKYRHEDIVDVDANTTLRACAEGRAPVVADRAQLNGGFGCEIDSGKDLTFLRTGFFNVGQQETDGLDLNLRYTLKTSDGNQMKFYFAASETFSYERQIAPDLSREDLLGRLSGENEIGRPARVADFGVDVTQGDWSWSVSGNYTAAVEDGDFRYDDHPMLDDWLVWSASAGYQISDKSRVLFSVRNLLDEAPPFASSPTSGYAASIHDFFGRVASLRWTHRF